MRSELPQKVLAGGATPVRRGPHGAPRTHSPRRQDPGAQDVHSG